MYASSNRLRGPRWCLLEVCFRLAGKSDNDVRRQGESGIASRNRDAQSSRLRACSEKLRLSTCVDPDCIEGARARRQPNVVASASMTRWLKSFGC